MNKLSLLAHPDLPKELFVKAMKILAIYFNNPKNRHLPVTIGKKLSWDDIRELKTFGVGIAVLMYIREVLPKGTPITEDELKNWAFPEIMKLPKDQYNRELSRWTHRLTTLINPEIDRLQGLGLSELKLWHNLVDDADKQKSSGIIKRVLSDKSEWSNVIDELKSIQPNLLELQFEGGVPSSIGPSERKEVYF